MKETRDEKSEDYKEMLKDVEKNGAGWETSTPEEKEA